MQIRRLVYTDFDILFQYLVTEDTRNADSLYIFHRGDAVPDIVLPEEPGMRSKLSKSKSPGSSVSPFTNIDFVTPIEL